MMRERGQASIEVLALLPVLIVACLVAVQVVALLAAASSAQDRARSAAMVATGDGTVRVRGSARVTRVLPVMPRFDAVTVVASVRPS
ncbi:MAG: hypothetical protein EXQ74_07345 [Thermoleophilia bacterium]|nr:hypothetical protein [Thermoleophilia bacterium]